MDKIGYTVASIILSCGVNSTTLANDNSNTSSLPTTSSEVLEKVDSIFDCKQEKICVDGEFLSYYGKLYEKVTPEEVENFKGNGDTTINYQGNLYKEYQETIFHIQHKVYKKRCSEIFLHNQNLCIGSIIHTKDGFFEVTAIINDHPKEHYIGSTREEVKKYLEDYGTADGSEVSESMKKIIFYIDNSESIQI